MILRFYDSSFQFEIILYILCRVKKIFLTTFIHTNHFKINLKLNTGNK